VIYLESFRLATESDETDYILDVRKSYKLDMACHDMNNSYPFKIFPFKYLSRLDFAPITLLYGGNGSGKSTLLNIIAQKLKLRRTSPYSRTPFFEDYLAYCRAELYREKNPPEGSCIITSDDVFDYMLSFRTLNAGVDRDREALIEEWRDLRRGGFQMRSLEDFEELQKRREAWSSTRSEYTARRLPKNLPGQSNGENAYGYFAEKIRGNALYLLDEPENSLSAERQTELAAFLEDSARFYGCQFIISTHSPFLLAMKGARIYDLDEIPVTVKKWTELSNVRRYHEFFEKHRMEFESDES
jgi:predicted ATPase